MADGTVTRIRSTPRILRAEEKVAVTGYSMHAAFCGVREKVVGLLAAIAVVTLAQMDRCQRLS